MFKRGITEDEEICIVCGVDQFVKEKVCFNVTGGDQEVKKEDDDTSSSSSSSSVVYKPPSTSP